MLISHHPASAECLQLGEGMLLCGFDLDKALSSRDPLDCMAEAVADDTKRIGTTCGGGIFRAVPREFDPESGSHRLPFAGSIRFTFLAQNDRPGDVNLPARLYWWKEETHDAA